MSRLIADLRGKNVKFTMAGNLLCEFKGMVVSIEEFGPGEYFLKIDNDGRMSYYNTRHIASIEEKEK